MTLSADVAIVGAGMGGASLAAALAPRASVLLLEAEDRPGYHATGRSAAFWEESYGGPDVFPLTAASGPFLRDHGFLRPRGALTIGREAERGQVEAMVDRFAALGVRIELLGREAIAAHVSGLRPEWRWAAWEPGCSDIDVAALHAHYLAEAQRGGVRLLTRARLAAAVRENCGEGERAGGCGDRQAGSQQAGSQQAGSQQAHGQPAQGQSAQGQSAQGQSAQGQPAQGRSAANERVGDHSVENQPVGGPQADDRQAGPRQAGLRPPRARRWWLTLENGATIACDILVNAAGAWADPVARMAGARPLGIAPKRRTVVQLRTEPSAPEDLPLVLDIDERFYFKPDNGRLWLSPLDETPSEPCDSAPEEIDVALAVERLGAVVDWRVPAVERKWAGLRSFAPDRLPVYGFDPAVQGFFWCAGQGGFGIQTAPAAADLAAALLLGETPQGPARGIDPAPFSPQRFG